MITYHYLFIYFSFNLRKIEVHELEHVGSYMNAVNGIKLLNTGEIRERYETCRLLFFFIFFSLFILPHCLSVSICWFWEGAAA